VQFTPDLMPQDITGLNIYNQKDGEFHLVKGPVFTNILLADEINRATPRTQSSLLEAMEERQVTIDGETLLLEEPFLVIATENPIETSGTYPLPEAQLDRFMMNLEMGQLTHEEELAVLERFLGAQPMNDITAVCSKTDIQAAREAVKQVFVHPCVMDYLVSISEATRSGSKILTGVSPRASLMLLRGAQAFAAISGRSFVTPDDVRFLAPYVFAHRIVSYQGQGRNEQNRQLLAELVKAVPVPVENWEN
jgi:MoxR-like ATPase